MVSLTRDRLLLLGWVILIAAGLMVYAQTMAFAWDEGFHMLAAQLILRGMKPYIDFFHAQTPLYAYWNAFWFRLFHDTWRTAHTISTLSTAGAVWLTGAYVYDRFQGGVWRENWRLPMTFAAVMMVGLNSQIFEFGTIGQAYGLCLLGIVAAFRCTIATVRHNDARYAVGAGFFAGVAAASSLLTAPMAPVMLVWMLKTDRLKRLVLFCAGGIVPFVPLLILFAKSPKVVFFGAVKFHLFYRTVDWSGSGVQNAEVATDWLESPHAMLMALLVLLALVFLARHDIGWPLRRELHLCMWLSAVEGAYLLYVRPTFPRYYLFIVPFMAILSVAGFYYAGTHIGRPEKPQWILILFTLIMAGGLGRTLHGSKADYRWTDWEKIAKKVDEVTPPGGIIYADEAVYFLARKIPPSGLEYEDTHKLRLSPALENELHIFPREELMRRVKAGAYDTVATCEDDDKIKEQNLPEIYKQKVTIGDCSVFWDKEKQ